MTSRHRSRRHALRAQRRLDACVAGVVAARARRNIPRDPFGSAVIEDAAAVAKRFSLRDATVEAS